MKVYCTLTREQATLYEAVCRTALRRDRRGRGHPAPRPGAGAADAAQADLQPPGAVPARRQRAARPHRQAGAPGRDAGRGRSPRATARWSSPSTPRWARCCKTICASDSDREVLFLHGGTADRPSATAWSRASRTTRTARRCSSSRSRRAASGLNLTRANHVFHFDRWWNPAVENQATDRAFRIGQTRNVQVHKFVCAGTLEEKLDELIEQQAALAESIVGTSEAWITEMSTDELRDLFALRREDAVAEDEAVSRATTRWWERHGPRLPGGRHQGPNAARRVRQDLVGQPLDRRAGAPGQPRPPGARPLLRAQRPGRCRSTSSRGGVHGAGAGQPAASRTRSRSSFKQLTDAEWERVIDAHGRRGAVRRAAAERRDARADRGGLRRRRAPASSRPTQATCRRAAPAPTGPTRASTSPRSTTCSASASTTTPS